MSLNTVDQTSGIFQESFEVIEKPYILAALICQRHSTSDYMLYENGNNISIGIGIHALISVTESSIILKKQEKEISYPIKNDLCETLQHVCQEAETNAWKFYGLANFSLAKYNHHIPLGNEDEILIKLFVPEVEYALAENSIVIKTHTTNDRIREEKMWMSVKKDYYNFLNTEHPNDVEVVSEKPLAEQDADYYQDIVSKCVAEIKNDYYQKAIMSRKIRIDARLDMPLTYILGRTENNPARSYLIKWDDEEVVGFSPETVAEIDANATVYTFPLAGTRALTDNVTENGNLKRDLLRDTKEISEHAVSVKLAFEELQHVCDPDSVAVTDFMSVLDRGTVQHLGSRLKGHIKGEYNSWHALLQLFPAVTASGIPKYESIAAIARLEKDPRKLYSGSILMYENNGALDAALVLRTIFQNPRETWLRAGAGIVEMSKPKRELEESSEKLRCVTQRLVVDKNKG